MMTMVRAGVVAAAMMLAAGAAHAAAGDVQTIGTPGTGDLTMCPTTFAMMRDCNLYHHIKIPPQISVGDRVRVRFGSNPKRYNFPVARIVRDGSTCTVYSQATDTENVEKIQIVSCGDPPPPE